MDATEMIEQHPMHATYENSNHQPILGGNVLTYDRGSKTPSVTNTPKTLRVLVIGDVLNATEVLVDQVRHWGHEALGANDGLAALRLAAVQHPHVVLLKMEMPFMNGCQITRQLRRDFPGKKCLIVALTGHADAERREQCHEAGIDVLLSRPVVPSIVETLLMLESVLVNRSWDKDKSSFKIKLPTYKRS